MKLINLYDFERQAKEILSPMVWGYYASGSDDGTTLRRNREAYDQIALLPRVLVDVSQPDLRVVCAEQTLNMPLLVAPMAYQGMATAEGELATTRAAGRQGTAMLLSTLSNVAMEEVVQAATGPVWFQLYVYRDRELTRSLVERAEKAGCKALVVTVDAPVIGRREADERNAFRLPEGLHMANVLPAGTQFSKMSAIQGESGLVAYFRQLLDASLQWKDIEWLRSISRLPIWLKGILRADDALRAHQHGATGVIISNHGGRQLDTAIPTIQALPAIAEAIAGRMPLLIDGGIRRGTDILKALALGAQGVLVGRPILWGLAVNGEEGAFDVLQLLREELTRAMALCGCPTVADISRDLVAHSGHSSRG